MLKSAANRRILYFSADDFDVPANSIHDIASDAFLLGYEGVFIDEIHFDSNWDRVLKSLSDKYEDKIIWASDSSSLRLRSAIGATARRYIHTSLPLMSFREYLFMKTGKNYPKILMKFSRLGILKHLKRSLRVATLTRMAATVKNPHWQNAGNARRVGLNGW